MTTGIFFITSFKFFALLMAIYDRLHTQTLEHDERRRDWMSGTTTHDNGHKTQICFKLVDFFLHYSFVLLKTIYNRLHVQMG